VTVATIALTGTVAATMTSFTKSASSQAIAVVVAALGMLASIAAMLVSGSP
jgi:hypothetical protein